MKRLVIDTSNILFRVAAASSKYGSSGTPEEQAGLAMHSSLNTLKSYYRKIKPDQVALAFEGSNNWRKAYTRSAECKSQRLYKGNRVKDESSAAFYALINAFEDLARKHSSLVCLSHPDLEGDDCIAGYVQHFSDEGDEVVILSGDKDFTHLLCLPNVSLLNPDDGKLRGWDKKTGEKIDPEYFMFEKAIRGDSGDNVLSAYPRVRATRIMKAFKNEYDRTNLMAETWEFIEPSDGSKRTMVVGELFEENQTLMNLFKQPPHIRELIKQVVQHEIVNHGRFDYFQFTKFCAKFGLKKIAEDAQHFIELFSSTGLNSPLREETKAINAEKKARTTLVF